MNTKNINLLIEVIRPQFQGAIEFEAQLAKTTYYQIGGPAEVLFTPKNLQDLQLIHSVILSTEALPVYFLGWGSNLLISDAGLRGVVIRMKQVFTEIEKKEEGILRVGASVGGSTLLRKAQKEGFSGLSHLTGIPGSVGGMVTMNAGTHLGEWKDCALSVEFVSMKEKNFELKRRVHVDGDFSYRQNHFLKPFDLVTHAEIKYTPGDPEKVEAEIAALYQRRKDSQPVEYPSCGSVFMNPQGERAREQGCIHAWQVIERLKLRGHRVGDAQFSEKHCNFIINHGKARAVDVLTLIDLAKTRALQELGIELVQEVKFVE